MSAPNKKNTSAELDAIEDAFVQSIMLADEKVLRDELVDVGFDPDELIAEFDRTIASTKLICAKRRLEVAKKELTSFRAKRRTVTAEERKAAKDRFEKAYYGNSELASKMMMAARKGEGLSDRDLDGLVDDIVELKHLEDDDESA